MPLDSYVSLKEQLNGGYIGERERFRKILESLPLCIRPTLFVVYIRQKL